MVVCVGERDGVPFVAARRRVELVDEGVDSQPFHHAAEDLDGSELEARVERLRASAGARAEAALVRLHEEHGPLRAVALEEERRAIPASLAEIRADLQLLIAADGALYRGVFRAAAEGLGAEVTALSRGSEIVAAAGALGAGETRVDHLLADLGRAIGPPWRVEHQKAAAAAIAALGALVPLRVPSGARPERD